MGTPGRDGVAGIPVGCVCVLRLLFTFDRCYFYTCFHQIFEFTCRLYSDVIINCACSMVKVVKIRTRRCDCNL